MHVTLNITIDERILSIITALLGETKATPTPKVVDVPKNTRRRLPAQHGRFTDTFMRLELGKHVIFNNEKRGNVSNSAVYWNKAYGVHSSCRITTKALSSTSIMCIKVAV